MPNLPYPVAGQITDSDGANPSGAKVVLRNDRSGEKISTTTNDQGEYVLDAANLTSGYVESDRLTVICAFGDEDNESSFLISDNLGGNTVNLTLATIAESSDTTYCQVQDVLDELGDKTTSDISYERIRKIILRSEAEIDERTNSNFGTVLVQDEEYDLDQHTSWSSPEQHMTYRTDYLVGTRNDHWNTFFNDRFKLKKAPILSSKTQLNGATTTSATTITVDSTSDFPSAGTIFIYNGTNGTEQITYTGTTSTTFTGCTRGANSTTATAHADNSYVTMISLSKNDQGKSSSDSWTDLEPQVGAGGDFLLKPDTGIITFVDNIPALGFRRTRASYTYGYVSVPKTVERLCILLSVRDTLVSKGNQSQFDSTDSISLEGISISKGITSSVSYFTWLTEEINKLWDVVGTMRQISG